MKRQLSKQLNTFLRDSTIERVAPIAFWLALSLLNIALICQYASPYPLSDDWGALFHAGSLEGMTLNWIMEPRGGFFKPITWSLMRFTYEYLGGDLRPALILMFSPVIVGSLFVLITIQKSDSDLKLLAIAIPACMLSIGFFGTISWYTASSVSLNTASIVWAITCFYRHKELARPAFTVGILITLSLLQGIFTTVMLAPFVIVAILEVALPTARTNAGKSNGKAKAAIMAMIWFCGSAWTLWCAAAVSIGAKEGGAELGDALATYIQFNSMSLGLVNRKIWPLGGVAIILSLAVFAYLNLFRLNKGICSLRESLRDLACIAPIPLIGLLFALQRSHNGALVPRYACYAVPLFVGLFLVMLKYTKHSRIAKLTLYCLFLMPVSSFWFDCQVGIAAARIRKEGFRAVQAQLHQGCTIEEIFAQHGIANQNFHWAVPVSDMLSNISGSDWQNLSHAEYKRHNLNLNEVKASGLSLQEGIWCSEEDSADCYLSFEFPEQFVDLVWIDYQLESKPNSMPLTIKWKNTSSSLFDGRSATRLVHFNPAEKVRTGESLPLALNGRVSQLAIYPGVGDFRFQLKGVTLLKRKDRINKEPVLPGS